MEKTHAVYSTKTKIVRLIIWLFLAFVAIITIFPVCYVIFGSFKDNKELLVGGSSILPSKWVFDNYVQAWKQANFATYTMNSVFLSLAVMLISLINASMAGYVFARKNFKGKELLYMLFVAFMFINVGSVSLRPLFELAVKLKMNKSLLAVAIISAGGGQATFIFLCRGFVNSVPKELDEAAKMDGANSWQLLKKVTIPMVMPSITICTFLTLTNSFKLFDQNLALTAGEPSNSSQMLALNIYETFYTRTGWEGAGQAKAVVFFIIVAVIAMLQNRLTRSKEVQQ